MIYTQKHVEINKMARSSDRSWKFYSVFLFQTQSPYSCASLLETQNNINSYSSFFNHRKSQVAPLGSKFVFCPGLVSEKVIHALIDQFKEIISFRQCVFLIYLCYFIFRMILSSVTVIVTQKILPISHLSSQTYSTNLEEEENTKT